MAPDPRVPEALVPETIHIPVDPTPAAVGVGNEAAVEAGHAVVYSRLRGPDWVEFATIDPDEAGSDLGGFVRVRILGAAVLWPSHEKHVFLRHYGTKAYAGVASQYRELDTSALPENPDLWELEEDELLGKLVSHSQHDREGLAWVAKSLGCSRPADRWHWPSWRRARSLVETEWPTITSVAASLLDRGRIEGDEVDTLVWGRRKTTGSRLEKYRKLLDRRRG